MNALVVALAVVSSATTPVVMFTPSVVNLEPTAAETFGALCAAQYGLASQSRVIGPKQAQAAIPEGGDLAQTAKTLGAAEYVELNLVSLATSRSAGRILVSTVLRSVDGQELAHAELAADSLDDAPVVCERLALALVRRVDPAQTLNRKNVTLSEAKASARPNRVGSEKIIGVKTALAVPLAMGANLAAMGTLGVDVRLEQERYFIEFGANIIVPATFAGAQGYGGLGAELGASYYLTTSDVAPYVGAGLQPRIFFSTTVFNLAPYAQFGLMFMRQSSTRLYVDARISQNVLPVAVGFTGSATLFPTELTLQAGIGF